MPSEPDYRVSLDPAELQLDVIHGFLTQVYWSPGVPRELVARAIRNSMTVGAYAPDGSQVGFGRLTTDYASFGHLSDVFVLEPHRGRGLAARMVRALLEAPETRSLRRITLVTRDAHGLYRKFGFGPLADPGAIMELLRPGNYQL